MVKMFENFIINFELIEDRYEIKSIKLKTGEDITNAVSEIEALTSCDTFETLICLSKVN
jgi:hypothetical protein